MSSPIELNPPVVSAKQSLIEVTESIKEIVVSCEVVERAFSMSFQCNELQAVCHMAEKTTHALMSMSEACEMVPSDITAGPKNVIDAEFAETDITKDENKDKKEEAKKPSLMDKVQGKVMGYVNTENVGKLINLSDQYLQTTAKLNMIVDDGGSVTALQEKIYASAQQSGMDYMNAMSAISDLKLQTGAFSSDEDAMEFAGIMNMEFLMGGASQEQASSQLSALTESMSTGMISDGALALLSETAPSAVSSLAGYLNVSNEKLLEMAANGEITAGIFKDAMLSSSDAISERFSSFPMTFEQMWTSIKNGAMFAFQPVLQKIIEIANSPAFAMIINGVIAALSVVGSIVAGILELISSVAGFLYENWSFIGPLLTTAAIALGVFTAALGLYSLAAGISAIVSGTDASAKTADAAATGTATIAQNGFNLALLTSPAGMFALIVTAIVLAVMALCEWISNLTGLSTSGFGIITGGINVVIQFFWNLCLTVANIAMAIWNALCAVANNIRVAFHNAICNIQSWWYDLLATVCEVVSAIAEELNKIPFVEIDYSGVENAAQDYRDKALKARNSKEEYSNIGEEFDKGMHTYDAFKDGWMEEAFAYGAAWGDSVVDNISSSFDGLFGSGAKQEQESLLKNPQNEDLNNLLNDSAMNSNIAGIADNTSNIKDSLDITQEDLKYMRDLAERDAINRFTTAEIKVEMNNSNQINSTMDLDGIVDHLSLRLREQMEIAAEGVH